MPKKSLEEDMRNMSYNPLGRFGTLGTKREYQDMGMCFLGLSKAHQIELFKETIASDDPVKRREAGVALEKYDAYEVWHAIVEVLIDDNPERQQKAMEVLGGTQASQIIRSIVMALEEMGTPQAIAALSLCVTARSFRVQQETLAFLEYCHTQRAVEALIQALESDNPTTRFQVVMMLAKHPDLRATHGLLKSLVQPGLNMLSV